MSECIGSSPISLRKDNEIRPTEPCITTKASRDEILNQAKDAFISLLFSVRLLSGC